MLVRLPKLKFVIMTLGEHGCVMLERCSNGELFSIFPICNYPIILDLTNLIEPAYEEERFMCNWV